MEWASQLGLVLFLLASCITGGRLLWRGLRSGDAPEWLLGTSYLVGGPFGYIPLILVMAGVTPDAWTLVLRSIGYLGLEVSSLALYAFNQRVFRPENRWVVPAAGFGLFVGWLCLMFSGALHERTIGDTFAYWYDFAIRGGAYVWATVESIRHYRRARLRVAIGLLEPAVANRFLLWGIAMGAVSGMFLTAPLTFLLTQDTTAPVPYLVDGVLASIASVAVWISFFAPRRYLGWQLSAVWGGAPDRR